MLYFFYSGLSFAAQNQSSNAAHIFENQEVGGETHSLAGRERQPEPGGAAG